MLGLRDHTRGSGGSQSMSAATRRIVQATAFVDWNSQIHLSKPGRHLGSTDVARVTLNKVGRAIGRVLTRLSPTLRFTVQLRLYHGWHKGFERTVNRRAVAQAIAECDFAALSAAASISLRPEIAFGDLLISGLDDRRHPRMGIHLPATLRDADTRSGVEEKLVDTSIAADVVDLAHREPWQWLLILAEDDDLIAPIIAAEAILRARPEDC